MAAPTFSVGAGTTAISDRTVSLAGPVGRRVGELLLASLYVYNTEAITTPSGWNLINQTAAPAFQIISYWRIATGDSSDTFTASWTNSVYRQLAVGSFAGAARVRPIIAVGADNSGTSTSLLARGFNLPVKDCLLFWAGGVDTVRTFTVPSGFTRYDDNDGVYIGLAEQSSVGATGDKTGTVNTSVAWVTHMFAIAPASMYYDAVMADSPTAYFPLNEASGTSALDAMGGASGTYTGGYTLAQTSLIADDNRAVLLNGSTGYVRAADRAAFDLGDVFTLEAWVQLTALPRSGAVAVVVDKGAQAYILRIEPDGSLILRRNSVLNICTATVRLAAGNKYHIFITKSGATVRMFVNGVDVTGTVTNSTMQNTAIEFNIGSADAGSTGNMLGGVVDEVAVYSTALSSTRAAAHYAAGTSSGPVTEPVTAAGTVAGGNAPVARAGVNTAGAIAGGNAPRAYASVGVASSVASANNPVVRTVLIASGATAGGNSPILPLTGYVRRFNGTSYINMHIGAANINTDITIAILFRPDSTFNSEEVLYAPHVSASPVGYQYENVAQKIGVYNGSTLNSQPTSTLVANRWIIGVIAKRAGTARVQYHTYDFASARWLHEESTGTFNSPGASSPTHVRIGLWGSQFGFSGDMMAAAVWASVLPDSVVEELTRRTSIEEWANVDSPVALWLFRQSDVAELVDDLVGTSDQWNAQSGTVAVNDVLPMPYEATGVVVPVGRSTAGGNSVSALARASIGASTAGGIAPVPVARSTETVPFAGAIAGAQQPRARVIMSIGGALAQTTSPRPASSLVAGSSTARGIAPVPFYIALIPSAGAVAGFFTVTPVLPGAPVGAKSGKLRIVIPFSDHRVVVDEVENPKLVVATNTSSTVTILPVGYNRLVVYTLEGLKVTVDED